MDVLITSLRRKKTDLVANLSPKGEERDLQTTRGGGSLWGISRRELERERSKYCGEGHSSCRRNGARFGGESGKILNPKEPETSLSREREDIKAGRLSCR